MVTTASFSTRTAVAVVAQRSDAVHGRADVVALDGGRSAEDVQAGPVAGNHVAGRGGGAANRGRAADRSDANAAAEVARRRTAASSVPVMSVPMKLPCTVKPIALLTMPVILLLKITLRAPAAVPPIEQHAGAGSNIQRS